MEPCSGVLVTIYVHLYYLDVVMLLCSNANAHVGPCHCLTLKSSTVYMLQTPNEVLPPPPSAVTDTEHWERAMFRDRQERMDRSGGVGVWQEKLSSWVSMRRREQS